MISEATEPPRCVWSSARPSGKSTRRVYFGARGRLRMCRVKVGIVVPFSWSFSGGVNEHAELQSAALRSLGLDVRTVIGNDPPGTFTRALHPRYGRHDDPPDDVIPVGRSVIVPANGSLPNIVLTARVRRKVRRALAREHFDVLHLHEPMTPAICVAALAAAECPVVATFHASGELKWYQRRACRLGLPDEPHRLQDRRLRAGAHSAARWLPARTT